MNNNKELEWREKIGCLLINEVSVVIGGMTMSKHRSCNVCHTMFEVTDRDDKSLKVWRDFWGCEGDVNKCAKCDKSSQLLKTT